MQDRLENTVRQIISSHKCQTQSDVLKHLQKKGIAATQSTVSRVLNKIQALKALDEKGQIYYKVHFTPLAMNSNLVLNIVTSDTLVIIKTRSGAAGHVAELIDEIDLPEIAGTLAGDNAIFISPFKTIQRLPLAKKLKEMFL